MSANFRNTTALVAAFSLAIPAVAPAQTMVDRCEAGSVGISADVAAELDITLPDAAQAALDGGASSDDVIVTTKDGTRELCMTFTDLEALGVSEASVVMAVEGQPAEAEVQAEAAPEPEEKGLLQGALDAVTGNDAPAEEQQAEAPVEEPAAPEAEVTAEAEAEVLPEATPEAEPMAEAEADATAEVEPMPEADATVETAPMPEADAETVAEAEADAQVEAEAEAEVETATEENGDGGLLKQALDGLTKNDEAPAEADMAEAEQPVAEEATAEAEQELQEMAKAIEQQSAEEADPEAQAEVAETEAPKASAASDENAEVTEVEEETVTEAQSRSSSEEFADKINGVLKGDGTKQASNNDKGGLSDLEKALLVGVGAVVVGSVLKNNSKAQVVSKSDDRVVVLEDGRYRVIRDDNELIERPGSTVRRESFQDGSTRTTVTREDGIQIVTIRDPELRVLRRVRIDAEGNRTVLIDDTADIEVVDISTLPDPVEYAEVDANSDAEALRAALSTKSVSNRRFALYQVRNIERVRKLAPSIDLDAINFATGSAVIEPQEAEELSQLGNLIRDYVEENPGEVFLVEGHTDAVGNAAYNLALSDRRAESVALALTEYFDVPPENLVVQGYGESDLKVRTLSDERANRRAAVRRITPLITASN